MLEMLDSIRRRKAPTEREKAAARQASAAEVDSKETVYTYLFSSISSIFGINNRGVYHLQVLDFQNDPAEMLEMLENLRVVVAVSAICRR